ERVLPGHVVRELVANDRVIGGMTARCSERAQELYKAFVEGECVLTNVRTAELAKLTENASRDVSIAFANELSLICDKIGVDVWELIRLANRHPRVNILQPGPGVGGHCIAVDPWFIVSESPRESRLIKTARLVNDSKPTWVIDKVKLAIAELMQQYPSKTTRDISIACYGLTFKPDIDDLRESPAFQIAKNLTEYHSGLIYCVEPNIKELPESLSTAELVNANTALERADVHLMLVDHSEFKSMKVEKEFLIDTKGIWI
ncbi:MAG: nucleotide sugar dehydrogenase, partial [Kangiellaceae bacterium]|nr:nucleotide sugar dehydrogenase [Kangiellaceae bacterium]